MSPFDTKTLTLSSIVDLAGHPLAGQSVFTFQTGPGADLIQPSVVSTEPLSGAVDIPTNTIVRVSFTERLNGAIAIDSVFMLQASGGQVVPASVVLASDGRSATLTPLQPLVPHTLYFVQLSGFQLPDLAGNSLNFCCSWSFTTGGGVDTTAPTVIAVSPPTGATNVPTNAPITLVFSEPIRGASVTAATLLVTANGNPVTGSFSQSSDLRRVTVTPTGGLPGGSTVQVQVAGVTDLAGNASAPFTSTFVAVGGGVENVLRSAGAVATATSEYHASYDAAKAIDGDLNTSWTTAFGQTPFHGVPTSLDVQLPGAATISELRIFGNRPWGTPYDFLTGRFQLFDATNAELFNSGVVTFPGPLHDATVAVPTVANVRRVRFTGLSGGNSGYVGTSEIEAIGQYANPGDGGFPDTRAPQLVGRSPASGTTGVAVTSTIVWTFDEPIDPTTANERSLPVFISSFTGQIGGQYTVNGNVVTLTPFSPLPGNDTIYPYVSYYEPLKDLAGNSSPFTNWSFQTAATTDASAPSVQLVTPGNGATGVGRNVPIVITFSESMDPNTVNANAVAVFANGQEIVSGISGRSADNRTYTINSTWPAASEIVLVVTHDATDLAGNAVPDFSSRFSTLASFDTGTPSIVSQRPSNGASGVATGTTVVLYANEPLNQSTVSGAIFVSQDGVVVSGSTTVSAGGRALTFTPSAPFAENALIEVFATSAVRDLSGNPLNSYHTSFRTVNTAGPPTQVRFTPVVNSVVINPRIEMEFSEALNPLTVNPGNVRLLRSGTPVAGVVSLVREARVIRFTPDAALLPNTSYTLQILTGVQDVTGTAVTSTINRAFTTGSADDTTAPLVLSVAPPDGRLGVGVNSIIRLRFSERVNPLSVTGVTVRLSNGSTAELPCTITFSNNDRDVVIEPHGPLADLSAYSLTIDGVEDLAGNAVPLQTTAFMTANTPDFASPVIVRTVPQSSAVDVPLNPVIEVEVDEPIDGGLIDTLSFRIRDNTAAVDVDGTRSLSADGRILTFVPAAPLVASHSHTVSGTATDLANNARFYSFSFTTGASADVTAPVVAAISPGDGATTVPMNVEIWLRFNEPIQTPLVSDFRLASGGTPVSLDLTSVSDGNRVVRLRPMLPLAPSIAYGLTLVDIADLAGNALLPPTSFTFTTGLGADLISPSPVTFLPSGAGVATTAIVQATFSERINPVSITTSNLRVFLGGTSIAGTVAVSADGLSATFTPASTLAPNTTYSVQLFSETDLAGNSSSFHSWSFTTGN